MIDMSVLNCISCNLPRNLIEYATMTRLYRAYYNWFAQRQEKRLENKAKYYSEYESSISSLYKRNKKGCLFSLTQTETELETRKMWLNLVGSGIIVFLIQTLLSGITLLACNFLTSSEGRILSNNSETVFWTLFGVGIFTIVMLVIIYACMLRNYNHDRTKFEIQNKKLSSLVEKTK